MRHNVDGRKFGRNTSHRLAMFRNMANSVIHEEQIVTTVQKAKEARRVVDRLITLGKSGTPAARRMAFNRTRDNDVVGKLFGELAKRYSARPGGYTRVLRLSDRRWGDAAEMAILELVDHPALDRKKKPKAKDETEEKKESTADHPKDPFSKMRKLFSPKGKVSGGGKPSKGAGKSAAGRKTPTSGGGSKGSSSS